MVSLLLYLSAALRGYMGFYVPAKPGGGLVACPTGSQVGNPDRADRDASYLLAMSVCATLVERGGYINVLVLLFTWNAVKFAAVGVWLPRVWLTP